MYSRVGELIELLVLGRSEASKSRKPARKLKIRLRNIYTPQAEPRATSLVLIVNEIEKQQKPKVVNNLIIVECNIYFPDVNASSDKVVCSIADPQ